jgi:hypothetical protein
VRAALFDRRSVDEAGAVRHHQVAAVHRCTHWGRQRGSHAAFQHQGARPSIARSVTVRRSLHSGAGSARKKVSRGPRQLSAKWCLKRSPDVEASEIPPLDTVAAGGESTTN